MPYARFEKVDSRFLWSYMLIMNLKSKMLDGFNFNNNYWRMIMKLSYKVKAVKLGSYNKGDEGLKDFEISDLEVDVDLEIRELPELVGAMGKYVATKLAAKVEK